jgi:hypothetical protein
MFQAMMTTCIPACQLAAGERSWRHLHYQIQDERFVDRWINYYGPPGTIPNVSFQLALETNGFCPAGFFSNKVVVVGSSLKTLAANQRKDELRTPYTRDLFLPCGRYSRDPGTEFNCAVTGLRGPVQKPSMVC